MANIKDSILADARAKKPEYAERMELFEPTLAGLPAGLVHYVVSIKGLFGYLPISYIVFRDEFYSSLQPGDFSRLLQSLDLFNSDKFSALDIAILFLLIDYPSRDRRIIETVAEMELPEQGSEALAYKLAQFIGPAIMQRYENRIAVTFNSFNNRTGFLEQFKLTFYPSYHFDAESKDLFNIRD